MTNKHKGEVGFECGGQSYILRYSVNSLCELENALDLNVLGISQLMSNAATLRMSTVRTVLWAGMLDRHPGFQLAAAGDLMTELGFGRVVELVGAAFAASFPDIESAARPPMPGPTGPAGNGKDSFARGENSDSPTANSGPPRLGM